jgi:hypothetical protein
MLSATASTNLLHRRYRNCRAIMLQPAGMQERSNAALTEHGSVPSRSWASLTAVGRAFRHCRRAFVRSRHCSLCRRRPEKSAFYALLRRDRLDLSTVCVYGRRHEGESV